jgi:hypothetical protein
MNLLRSEWLKLTTVRTTWVMLGIGLAAEALYAGLYGLLAPPDTKTGEVLEALTGTGLLMVMVLVLGTLAITNEFRHGTTGSTFLATPRRWPVLVAKLAAAALLGLAAGLAFVAVSAGLGLTQFSAEGIELPPASDVLSIYAGVVVSFAILCGFGLGVGAVVRNQVGAIIATLAFFFILSPLPELLPGHYGDYFPAQAVGSLHGVENQEAMGQVAGGLVLAAWAAGLFAIGTVLTKVRDLNE